MTTLRIICTQAPPDICDGVATEFGLLETKELVAGLVSDEGLIFETDVSVTSSRAAGRVARGPVGIDVRGPAVQGRPGQRFLYFGWRKKEEGAPWMRRWKIHLEGLPQSGIAVAKLKADQNVWPVLSGGWQVER